MGHPRGWCLIAALLLSMPLVLAAREPTSLAQQLQARMGAIKTLTAEFTQRTMDADNQLLQSSQGRLWLSSGARFKIATLAPFEQTLISDGDNLWTIDLDLDQAVVRPLETDFEQVPILIFNAGAEAISRGYRVDYFASDGLEHFVLSPRSVSKLFAVLTISFDGNRPLMINIRDRLEQASEIKLMQLRLNPALDDAIFQPRLPIGIDLIDDR